MKKLIRKLLKEQEEIITLPPFHYFDNDWNLVLELSEGKPFKILGNVDLSYNQKITTLGNCYAVGGNLDLYFCENLESLGNLTEVGGYLDLFGCKNLQSIGNLTEVGGDLYLQNTPIAHTMTENKIRQQVNVGGKIYML
jgi:hypothetical protein